MPLSMTPVHPEGPRYRAPLVFLPGLWAGPGAWRRAESLLAHRGWEGWLVDLAGGGGVAQRAAALAAAVVELERPAVLIGADAGGIVALETARLVAAAAVVWVAPVSPGGRTIRRAVSQASAPAAIRVNGAPVPMTIDKGFVAIERTWSAGDVIALDLPMPVRRIAANEQVMANRSRVALQRGPIVYAAEWPDNPNGKVRNIVLPDGNRLSSTFRRDLLNGVQVITGRAVGLALDEKGAVRAASSRSWPFRMRRGPIAVAAR